MEHARTGSARVLTHPSIQRRIRFTVLKATALKATAPKLARAGRVALVPMAHAECGANARAANARRDNARRASARAVVAEMDVAERVRAATASVGIAAETAPTGSARPGIGERSIRRAFLPHGTTIVPIMVRARRLRLAPPTLRSGPHIETVGTTGT